MAGIVRWRGESVPRRSVESLLARMNYGGRCVSRIWADHQAVLGQLAPSAPGQGNPPAGPVVSPDGRHVLLFDGRVDNRDELSRDLAESRTGESDGRLVLRCLRTWGSTGIRRIIGPFALVLYDTVSRQVMAARDYAGLRSLHYAHRGSELIFATDLHPIIRSLPSSPGPNEGYVADLLNQTHSSNDETLVEGISRVAPGHLLTASPEGIRTRRLIRFDGVPDLRLSSDEEYEECFHEVLREAVRVRMPTNDRTACHLSGGIDSSCVTAMAADLAAGTEGVRAQAFTIEYPGMACDETRYSGALVARHGIPWTKVSNPGTELGDHISYAHQFLEFPDYPNGVSFDPTLLAARERGAQVLLTGIGGDQWFEETHGVIADMVLAGEWGAALGLAQSRSRQYGLDGWGRYFLKRGVAPILRGRLPGGLWRAMGWTRRKARGHDPVAPWVSQDFARRVDLPDRLRRRIPPPRRHHYEKAEMVLRPDDPWSVYLREFCDRAAARSGVDLRHPYLDRRVFEFCLSLPENLRVRDGVRKHVLRGSMKSLVPDEILVRRDKGEFSHLFLRPLSDPGAGDLLASPQLANRGWVRAREAQSLHRRILEQGSLQPRPAGLWPLWTILGLEIWVRAMSEDLVA